MGYDLGKRLVIGVSSSALFDLTESDRVFREGTESDYRAYQEEHVDDTLKPGAAYPFIQRLLSLNDLRPDDPLVEVIVMSRNDPETGLRVMNSIEDHGLPITRAVFQRGQSSHPFMDPLKMSLFLSQNADDVRAAVEMGLPAGHVQPWQYADDPQDTPLRIAFDFDGVLADDSSERVYAEGGLGSFQEYEKREVATPHPPGPLRDLLAKLNEIQKLEEARRDEDPSYEMRMQVAIVTARGAPAHKRAIKSLQAWGLRVDSAFFLGGVSKQPILDTLKPHIFFDDQLPHLEGATVPGVHIPFGVRNNVDRDDASTAQQLAAGPVQPGRDDALPPARMALKGAGLKHADRPVNRLPAARRGAGTDRGADA